MNEFKDLPLYEPDDASVRWLRQQSIDAGHALYLARQGVVSTVKKRIEHCVFMEEHQGDDDGRLPAVY